MEMSTPVLFETIVLVPTYDCLDSFITFMRDSNVRPHIRRLIYDDRWGNRPNFELVNTRIQAVTDINNSDFRALTAKAMEVTMLGQLFTILPNLDSLVAEEQTSLMYWNSTPRAWRWCPPRYIMIMANPLGRTLLGYARYPYPEPPEDGRDCYVSLLLAAINVKKLITSLSVNMAKWHLTAHADNPYRSTHIDDLVSIRQVFPSLQRLNLIFEGDCNAHTNGLIALADLVRSAPEVRTLKLQFGSPGAFHWAPDRPHNCYLSAILSSEQKNKSSESIFPKLRQLTLDSCICTEEHLTRFLSIHSSTLRQLTMREINLCRDKTDTVTPCWVRILDTLRSTLDLESFCIGDGELNNDFGRQRWHVNGSAVQHDQRLYNRVKRYVLDKDPMAMNPLQHVAADLQWYVNGKQEGFDYDGDDSWELQVVDTQMAYHDEIYPWGPGALV